VSPIFYALTNYCVFPLSDIRTSCRKRKPVGWNWLSNECAVLKLVIMSAMPTSPGRMGAAGHGLAMLLKALRTNLINPFLQFHLGQNIFRQSCPDFALKMAKKLAGTTGNRET